MNPHSMLMPLPNSFRSTFIQQWLPQDVVKNTRIAFYSYFIILYRIIVLSKLKYARTRAPTHTFCFRCKLTLQKPKGTEAESDIFAFEFSCMFTFMSVWSVRVLPLLPRALHVILVRVLRTLGPLSLWLS